MPIVRMPDGAGFRSERIISVEAKGLPDSDKGGVVVLGIMGDNAKVYERFYRFQSITDCVNERDAMIERIQFAENTPMVERLFVQTKGEALEQEIPSALISIRVRKEFYSRRIKTWADLMEFTEGDFRGSKGFGPGSIKEVKLLLQSRGLNLRKGSKESSHAPRQ